jgi:hypothetical protein
MRRTLTNIYAVIASGVLFFLGGCGNKIFLDQTKEVAANLDWAQEVIARRSGAYNFRVESDGKFAVTVVTDKGFKSLQSGQQKTLAKSEVVLSLDSKEQSVEGSVNVVAGSTWFIIQNLTNKPARMHLQCIRQ